MSYCRFSEGDVYLIMHCYGGWTCYLCLLNPEEDGGRGYKARLHESIDTLGQVRDHIQAHIDAGHEVPNRAMAMVLEEIEELGEEYENPYDGFI